MEAQLIRAHKAPAAEPPAAAVLAPAKQPAPRPKQQQQPPPKPKPAPATPALARAAPPRIASTPATENASISRLTIRALGSSRLGSGTADKSSATMTFAQQQLLEERQAAAAAPAATAPRAGGTAGIQQRQAARPAMKAAAVRPQQVQTPASSNYFAMLELEELESPGSEEEGEEEEEAALAAATAVPDAEASLGSWQQPLPLPSNYVAGPELAAAKVAWQHAPAEEEDNAELQAALAASMAAAPAPAWHAEPADSDAPAWTTQQQLGILGSSHSTASSLGFADSSAVGVLPVPFALQQPPATAPGTGFGDGYAAGLAAALRMQQGQAAQQWQQAGQQAWQQPAAVAAPPEQEPSSLWQQQDQHHQAQGLHNFQQHQPFPYAKAPQAEEADDDDAEVAALLGLMGIAA